MPNISEFKAPPSLAQKLHLSKCTCILAEVVCQIDGRYCHMKLLQFWNPIELPNTGEVSEITMPKTT